MASQIPLGRDCVALHFVVIAAYADCTHPSGTALADDAICARLEFGPAQAGLLCHRNFDFLRNRQF
jgi:hypothetical protein